MASIEIKIGTVPLSIEYEVLEPTFHSPDADIEIQCVMVNGIDITELFDEKITLNTLADLINDQIEENNNELYIP